MDFAILLADLEELEHAMLDLGAGLLGIAVAVMRIRYIRGQIGHGPKRGPSSMPKAKKI